jgi:hypothetical protein
MKKTLWTFLLLWASSAIKGLQANQGGHMELTRLKLSLMYVRSIKTFRLLFMSLLGMGFCLVLFLMGFIVFQMSLFLYSPWSAGTKMMVGFLSSAIYLLAALFFVSKIFAADKWLEIFHAEGIMDHLHKEAIPQDTVEPAEQRG